MFILLILIWIFLDLKTFIMPQGYRPLGIFLYIEKKKVWNCVIATSCRPMTAFLLDFDFRWRWERINLQKRVIPPITESEECSDFQNSNIFSQQFEMVRNYRNVRPTKAKRKGCSDAAKKRWEIFRRKKQAKVENVSDGVDKGEGDGNVSLDEVVQREEGSRGACSSNRPIFSRDFCC